MAKMKAAIFVEPGRIVLDDKPVPDVGPLDALMRVTTTTICGTDVHILKGEYPVARGLTIGHEPVGVRQHRDGHPWRGMHQRHPPGLGGDQGGRRLLVPDRFDELGCTQPSAELRVGRGMLRLGAGSPT